MPKSECAGSLAGISIWVPGEVQSRVGTTTSRWSSFDALQTRQLKTFWQNKIRNTVSSVSARHTNGSQPINRMVRRSLDFKGGRGAKDAICVAVRFRPLSSREIERGDTEARSFNRTPPRPLSLSRCLALTNAPSLPGPLTPAPPRVSDRFGNAKARRWASCRPSRTPDLT
jgi:hypothetical protein